MNMLDQAKLIDQITESVTCALTVAFAHMTNGQLKELVFSPYHELEQHKATSA